MSLKISFIHMMELELIAVWIQLIGDNGNPRSDYKISLTRMNV